MLGQVIALQLAINPFGYGLMIDGKPGPMTMDALAWLWQNRLLAGNQLPLDQRGDTDPTNDHELHAGRASWYGGPNDPGDYYEGQAYLPIADPDGGGPLPAIYTPKQYYYLPALDQFRQYLNPAMSVATTWPKRNGRHVGVSFFLLDHAHLMAIRLRGELHRLAKAGVPIYAQVATRRDRSKYIICRVLDWGPSERLNGKKWRYDVDLSKGAYADLNLNGQRGKDGFYNDHVWYRILPHNDAQRAILAGLIKMPEPLPMEVQ